MKARKEVDDERVVGLVEQERPLGRNVLELLEPDDLRLLEDLERVVLAVLVLAQPHAAERARPQRRVQLQVGELQLGVLHGGGDHHRVW